MNNPQQLSPPSPKMTVARLMEILKDLPPDSIVFVPGYGRKFGFDPYEQPAVHTKEVITYDIDGGVVGWFGTTVSATASPPKFAIARSKPYPAVVLLPELGIT